MGAVGWNAPGNEQHSDEFEPRNRVYMVPGTRVIAGAVLRLDYSVEQHRRTNMERTFAIGTTGTVRRSADETFPHLAGR